MFRCTRCTMTQPSPEQAREMLADIDQIARRMRNTTAASALGPNLVIWGLAWAAGFIGTRFWPTQALVVWTTILTLGMLASAFVGYRQHRQRLVLSEAEKKLGWQMLGFWLTVFAFA